MTLADEISLKKDEITELSLFLFLLTTFKLFLLTNFLIN